MSESIPSARLNPERSLSAFEAACKALAQASQHETELLYGACRAAVEAGGFDMAWVGIPNNDPNKSIIPVAHCGRREDIRYLVTKQRSWSDQFDVGHGPIGRTLREGKPMASADIGTDLEVGQWMPEAQELGYRGVIFLPLMDKDTALGFLGLYSNGVLPATDDQVAVLERITLGIAGEMVRLRLLNEAEQVKEATLKIALAISTRAGKDFFETFLTNVVNTFDADAGIIARICPDDREFAQTVAVMLDGEFIENFRYPLDDTPCRDLLNAHDCVIAENVAARYPASTQLNALGAEAYIGTQLYKPDGQVIGFLYLIFRIPLKHTDHIRSILHIFAHTASIELAKLPR